jgi:hypothetical protein
MAIKFTFSNNGKKYYATPDNDAHFYVGTETTYLGNVGMMNINVAPECMYRPEDYVADYGFWAYFIAPTAQCESKGSFYCFNSYDRAQFTFTFMQYAAHVPNGDFVRFFKRLLQLDKAADYFPKLTLANNRIQYKNADGTLRQLEDDKSTQNLMDYLNPSLKDVDDQELISAARLVHWAMHDEAHRKLQVELAVDHFKNNLVLYSKQYALDGAPDKVCIAVCDIRHQGRAKSSDIIAALNTDGDYEKAYTALVGLGGKSYPERVKTLADTIATLTTQNVLGKKKYRQETGGFIDQ